MLWRIDLLFNRTAHPRLTKVCQIKSKLLQIILVALLLLASYQRFELSPAIKEP
jgi:hypothetical protein